MRDYDEIDRERERHKKLFGTAEELEAEARELAERQAQTRRDETLQWCKAREAERQRPAAVAEKTYAERAKDAAAWQQFVRDEVDKGDRALTKAIAQAIVNEERRAEARDDELMTIISDVRNRFDEMDARLSELEQRMSKRSPAIKCDGNARAFDVDLLRSEWRH